MKKVKRPRVLIYDVETAPILANVWKIWDETVGLNQISKDWHILSWAAKWLDEDKVMYMDQRKSKNVENDKRLLKGIWKLLDEADIVITQNGKKFDEKKLNARFIFNGMKPPSTAKHIDTYQIAKRKFAFTSNRLEYMSANLNTKYKKLKDSDRKYPGFSMWRECLTGNLDAWKEMERYNKYDVLALEELYKKLAPWDKTVNFNLYQDTEEHVCNCGSTNFQRRGYQFTTSGKFQRYQCRVCGAWSVSRTNLFTKKKRDSLRKQI